MSQHRPVPGISQGPKEFSPSSRVPIQSPMMVGQPGAAAVSEQMQDLAMEIYVRLAVKHIAITVQDNADNEQLQELAKASQAAALAYFQAGAFPNG